MKQPEIVSPIELWKDFDPCSRALNKTVTRTSDDGVTVRAGMYFDACGMDRYTIRAYAELMYTKAGFAEAKGYLPVVLLVCDRYDTGAQDCARMLTAAGYGVLRVDYSGDESLERSTIYPSCYSFARLDRTIDGRYAVDGLIKDTAWYVWTVIIRRAITLIDELDQVDASKIGVLGLRDGGTIAVHCAALDDRIKSAAVIDNTGWQNYGSLYAEGKERQLGFYDEAQARYNYSISIESYARFIAKPIQFLFGTNDTDNDFDRAFDTFSRLPQTLQRALSISPRADGSVCFRQLNNLLRWFDATVRFFGNYPDTPEIEAYVSDKRQYVRCTTKNPDHVTAISIYYAYNEDDFRIRNWFETIPVNVSQDEWIASIEVGGGDRYVFCFAVVTYDDNVTIASKQIAKKPSDLGLTPTPIVRNRLIYDATMGKDCFTAIRTGGLFDYADEVQIAVGPYDLTGVQTVVGELATYKPGDERFRGMGNELLTVTYYSPLETSVEIKLGVMRGDWEEYICKLDTVGGNLWNKISLSLTDFKGSNGQPPKDWSEVSRLSFARERGKTFLISTLLWT